MWYVSLGSGIYWCLRTAYYPHRALPLDSIDCDSMVALEVLPVGLLTSSWSWLAVAVSTGFIGKVLLRRLVSPALSSSFPALQLGFNR
jgi:hypothetical protein